MRRLLAGMGALWIAACGAQVGTEPDAGPDAAPPLEDGAAPLSEALPEREPWLASADSVARDYPAYGIAQHHMAHVYAEPKRGARAVGYLRRGSRFRASEEVTRKDCARGWFEVRKGGFVCNGEGVTVDSLPPAYDDAPILPALSDALPYRYAKVVTPDLPQFLRAPTAEEEQAVLAALRAAPVDPAAPVSDAPLPIFPSLLRMRMQPGFYVSVDRELEAGADGRRFLRTVRGSFLRAEPLAEGKQPRGLGVSLGNQFALPLAFTFRGATPTMRLDPISGELVKAGADLPQHTAYSLTGASIVKNGRRYFQTRDGLYLRDNAIRIVERVARPKIVRRGERWIRVDLDRQTLTAYEGDTPVFATLISSGVPDHATPTGLFRLHAKHLATTMADDLAADGPYSIEDVPWTMYFLGSYALHAAFWHERFGLPRSHGCVNLAPRDARWLFFWTLPVLPSAWHGVLADVGQGTTVSIDSGVSYSLEQDG